MKKFATFVMAVLLSIGSLSVFAAAEDEINVTLRIEGVDENFYYDTVTTTDTNLGDFLEQLGSDNDNINIVMEDGGYGRYLTEVNGDKAASYGAYSGWLFIVNGADPGTGMDNVMLKDGDEVVLYYGDPYGAGFQFPEADLSDIENGVITFTSKDTVYDENYNPSVVVNPVENAVVKWYSDDAGFTEYTTDAEGRITIDKELLTNGEHKVTIERYDDTGVPTVLRFAPDYTVAVDTDIETADFADPAVYAGVMAAMAVIFAGAIISKKEAYDR